MSRKPLGNAIPIAINKYINTAYDTILLVAQNLDTIKAVADQVTYLNTYLGESDTPPTKRPNGDPLESGDFYYDDKAVYYYGASDQSWTKVDPEELNAAAQTALDSANTAVQAKDEAVEAADKAKSYTSGTDIGDYTDDPTFNVITDYVVYGRGTAGITLWKVEENVTLPYDIISTTYSHPSDDPNLRAYTATAQLYTYEETTYLTDGQVIVDAQSELTNFVVYLWDAASGERYKLDVIYDYTTNASNQIVLLDTYPVGSKLTIVFEDIGQNSDTYIKKQEAEQLYGDHTKQANRGSANAHPASSISTTSGDNVEQALGKKATKEELDEGITEAQNDIVGGSIFKGSDGETVENGDVVEPGTTYLRVLVGGEPTIVVMSPISSGVVSSISDYTATIGGVDVVFNPISTDKDYVDVDWFDGDLSLAIRASKGKKIIVNSEINVDAPLPSISQKVYLKGTGKVNFQTAEFLTGFTGDFIVSGVHLHSDTQCVVVNYATDSHIGNFALIDKAKLSGAVKFLYNSSRTLNPDVTPHGIDVIWIVNIDTEDTLETLVNFDNAPYKLCNIELNRVKNFSKVFVSLANSNNHAFPEELQLSQELCVCENNNAKNDDTWWTTNAQEIVTYGAFLIHEGNVLRYGKNIIEGIKARRQSGDAGLPHSTAYWLYMGAKENYVYGNRIKNCFSFGSRDLPNVAFKQKQGTKVFASDNRFEYDSDWLSRIGEAIDPVNDHHVIHDVEPGWIFEDVDYNNNYIELMANYLQVFCNAGNYSFTDNEVRKGPTNLSEITIAFPIIDYDDNTLSNSPVSEYSNNKVFNDGGSVIGPYVRSTRTSPFSGKPKLITGNNEYSCNRLVSVQRVQGDEDFVVVSNDNSAEVTEYGSIFSTQGVNAKSAVVSGSGNSIRSIPASLTTQKGFGLVPYSSQTDISLSISSEGSIADFIIFDGAVSAPKIKYAVTGEMKTTIGLRRFTFLFTIENQSPGVNIVTFLDSDGSTQRVVSSNVSSGFFCEQKEAGSETRLYIIGSASNNNIKLSISESSEGVISDESVNYSVNVYGIKTV